MCSIGPLPLRGPLPLAGGGKMPIPHNSQHGLRVTMTLKKINANIKYYRLWQRWNP